MYSKRLLYSLAAIAMAGSAGAGEIDKPALNPDVTQATIVETICTTGWTQTVRPYISDMKLIEAEMQAAVGEPIERRNQYELDQLVPSRSTTPSSTGAISPSSRSEGCWR